MNRLLLFFLSLFTVINAHAIKKKTKPIVACSYDNWQVAAPYNGFVYIVVRGPSKASKPSSVILCSKTQEYLGWTPEKCAQLERSLYSLSHAQIINIVYSDNMGCTKGKSFRSKSRNILAITFDKKRK